MLLGVPVPNAPAYLADKVETALIREMSEIADQVGDGMIVTCPAMTLKQCHDLSGPGDVVGSVDHVFDLSQGGAGPMPQVSTLCAAMSEEENIPKLPCVLCGTPMMLVRVTPKLGAFPELRTFVCIACGDVRSVEIKED